MLSDHKSRYFHQKTECVTNIGDQIKIGCRYKKEHNLGTVPKTTLQEMLSPMYLASVCFKLFHILTVI